MKAVTLTRVVEIIENLLLTRPADDDSQVIVVTILIGILILILILTMYLD